MFVPGAVGSLTHHIVRLIGGISFFVAQSYWLESSRLRLKDIAALNIFGSNHPGPQNKDTHVKTNNSGSHNNFWLKYLAQILLAQTMGSMF